MGQLGRNILKIRRCYYHTGYPETTNATDNNKRRWNHKAKIGCKYLFGNKFQLIKLICGKLFPDWYLLIDFSSVCYSVSRWLSLGNRCGYCRLLSCCKTRVSDSEGYSDLKHFKVTSRYKKFISVCTTRALKVVAAVYCMCHWQRTT